MSRPTLKTQARKVIAWAPMWTLYWTGHWVSVALNRLPDNATRLFMRVYPVYNRCMVWSMRINDWAGFSLWGKR